MNIIENSKQNLIKSMISEDDRVKIQKLSAEIADNCHNYIQGIRTLRNQAKELGLFFESNKIFECDESCYIEEKITKLIIDKVSKELE